VIVTILYAEDYARRDPSQVRRAFSTCSTRLSG